MNNSKGAVVGVDVQPHPSPLHFFFPLHFCSFPFTHVASNLGSPHYLSFLPSLSPNILFSPACFNLALFPHPLYQTLMSRPLRQLVSVERLSGPGNLHTGTPEWDKLTVTVFPLRILYWEKEKVKGKARWLRCRPTTLQEERQIWRALTVLTNVGLKTFIEPHGSS